MDSIAVLVSGQWPLRQLDLGQNYVDDDGMAVTQLSRARWPDLETLVLAGNMRVQRPLSLYARQIRIIGPEHMQPARWRHSTAVPGELAQIVKPGLE